MEKSRFKESQRSSSVDTNSILSESRFLGSEKSGVQKQKDNKNPRVTFDNSTLLSVSATTGSKIVEQLENIEGKYEKRMKILIEENEKLKQILVENNQKEISPDAFNTVQTMLVDAQQKILHLESENKQLKSNFDRVLEIFKLHINSEN